MNPICNFHSPDGKNGLYRSNDVNKTLSKFKLGNFSLKQLIIYSNKNIIETILKDYLFFQHN